MLQTPTWSALINPLLWAAAGPEPTCPLVEWLTDRGNKLRSIEEADLLTSACELRARCGTPTTVAWCGGGRAKGTAANSNAPHTMAVPPSAAVLPRAAAGIKGEGKEEERVAKKGKLK